MSNNVVGGLMMLSSIGAGIIHNFLGITSWAYAIPFAITMLFVAGLVEWFTS